VIDRRSISALGCAAWLAALAIGATSAYAGPPFRVTLTVDAGSKAGMDEVTVVARSVEGASCTLQVSTGRATPAFAPRSAGRSGAVRWRWLPHGIPSDVPWRFTVTCRMGSAWSLSWERSELGFPSIGGALVAPPSPGANPPGGSCNLQGVCFRQDPFPAGECTWYAAGRRPDVLGIVHGSAGVWLAAAAGRLPEGSRPVVGALAVWRPGRGGAGAAGHVGYVAAVLKGRILVDDANWTPTPASTRLLVHEHWESGRSPSGYIYGGPAGAGPSQ
jgi:surface antigen